MRNDARITIRLPEKLKRQLDKQAYDEGRSLNNYLRLHLQTLVKK